MTHVCTLIYFLPSPVGLYLWKHSQERAEDGKVSTASARAEGGKSTGTPGITSRKDSALITSFLLLFKMTTVEMLFFGDISGGRSEPKIPGCKKVRCICELNPPGLAVSSKT